MMQDQNEYGEEVKIGPAGFSYNLNERDDIEWGMKFGVNEAVDFQTEQRVKRAVQGKDQWFEAGEDNHQMLTTRIIV